MTPKTAERIVNKIKKIKAALAADKKRWGGNYDDSQGLRYAPLPLYIKLKDFKGGLRYLNWFTKNFPDDVGYPNFLFEWTFILFQCNKLMEAEKKLHLTHFSNIYLLDKFLGKAFLDLDENDSSNWDFESLKEHFHYNKNEEEFIGFANWISEKLQSKLFLDKVNRFAEIKALLLTESVAEHRTQLMGELSAIKCNK